MFRVDIDEFSSAATAVSSAATRAGESVARVGKVNSNFANLMSGAWMIAESHAYADLEVTLRMLAEGLTAMGATYADALASLEGELAPARDALLSAALSTAASPRVIRFEPYHNVAGACDFADGSLEDLEAAVAAAQSALSGLESAGGVSGPLSALSSLAGTQGTAIGEIRSSYMTYEAAVDAFEEEYANRLKPGEFVTDAMREAVAADLRAQYGEALDGGPFAFIDVFGDVGAALAGATGVAGAMDERNAALWRFAASSLFGKEGRGLKLADRQWLARLALGLSDDVRSAIPEGQTFWQFFKKGTWEGATDDYSARSRNLQKKSKIGKIYYMAEGRASGGKTQSIHSDIWNGSAVLGGARPIAPGDVKGVRGRAGQSKPFDDIGRCPRNGKDDTSFPHRRCRTIAWVAHGRRGGRSGHA